MILALDVENTNIVMGCFDRERIVFTSRVAADRKRTGDEYAISFKSILEMHGVSPSQVQGSIVASVTPALIHVIMDALRLLLGTEPLLVGPGVKTGLNILMDNPASLGSDLVVNAVAALEEYPAPLIVIDLGTATTLLAVNEKKSFVGSVIAPGVAVASDALSTACDQLPRITLEAPREVIGKNTVDCMKSGAVFGTAAMLDGLVERMEQQLGHSCTVIATGAMAEEVIPHCRREIHVDSRLLLKGLRKIYLKNTKSDRYTGH
ncbi:MAG: type III pantothenate kinase [Oscillospiraceae bacterium]|nr:type III pantothenate kinase [Oscillospiraceae bacterium]